MRPVLLALLLVFAAVSHAERWQWMSADQLSQALAELGYRALAQRVGDSDVVIFELAQVPTVALMLDCEDGRCGGIQLFSALAGQRADARALNDFNARHLHARAYLDPDGDLALETDLLIDGGLSVTGLAAALNQHGTLLEAMRRELAEMPGETS